MNEKSSEYNAEAEEFTSLLVQNERHLANRLIMKLVEENVSIIDIYLKIFQKSQHEIGRLWEENKITVAQEHFCTAATQLFMSELYPYIFKTPKIGRTMIATCTGGELHEIGIRMVADIFELKGWDTYFIGANAPLETVLQTIEQIHPNLVAISCSMTFNVTDVKKLIEKIRSEYTAADFPILAGGRPFNISEGLWEKVGADGWAPDAQQAYLTAMSITNGV